MQTIREHRRRSLRQALESRRKLLMALPKAACGCPTDGEWIYHRTGCPVLRSRQEIAARQREAREKLERGEPERESASVLLATVAMLGVAAIALVGVVRVLFRWVFGV